MTETFRTPLPPLNHKGTLSHSTPMLLLGSCFASNIGEKLQGELFDAMVNPFGNLYNPASIAEVTGRIASGAPFVSARDITGSGSALHCWLCHSTLSGQPGESRERYITRLNDLAEEVGRHIARTHTAVLTFGSTRIFTLAATGAVVANCHKHHPDTFSRSELSLARCEDLIAAAITHLRSLNPAMRVILTVSPLRYLSYGFHANAISKATLLLACNAVEKRFDNIIYYPSYEIMMDDLRDYRFYAPDMKHPNSVAVDYIYNNFALSFFDDSTMRLAAECAKLSARLAHRSICGGSGADSEFRSATIARARQMAETHPEIARQILKLIEQP